LLLRWQGGNLADRNQLLSQHRAEEIGITLSEEDQLDPEQSTSATIVHHPQGEVLLGVRAAAGLPPATRPYPSSCTVTVMPSSGIRVIMPSVGLCRTA
jgi:hypothetical protein